MVIQYALSNKAYFQIKANFIELNQKTINRKINLINRYPTKTPGYKNCGVSLT